MHQNDLQNHHHLLVNVTTADIEGTELANTFATPETVIERALAISESYPHVNEVAFVAVTVPDKAISPKDIVKAFG